MKKIFIIASAILLAPFIQAQTNPIDELFEKYSDKDGFTTVYISSKMFSLFAGREAKDDEVRNIISRLKSIRILTVEDSTLNLNLNFFKELGKKLDFSVYEELMAVKEGSDVTKFLIRQNGDIISELLVVTGGPGDNTLISIKGNLDMKTISEISRSSGIDDLEKLGKIENKPAPK